MSPETVSFAFSHALDREKIFYVISRLSNRFKNEVRSGALAGQTSASSNDFTYLGTIVVICNNYWFYILLNFGLW